VRERKGGLEKGGASQCKSSSSHGEKRASGEPKRGRSSQYLVWGKGGKGSPVMGGKVRKRVTEKSTVNEQKENQ